MGGSVSSNGISQVIKLAVIALLVVYLILPLFLLAGATGFGQILLGSYAERITDTWMGKPNVATSVDRGLFRSQQAQLNMISAYEGEARSSANTIHFVVVDFDQGYTEASGTGGDTAKETSRTAGYRPVILDIASADKTAVVVIAGQPIALSLMTSNRKPRALLGLESSAPVEVSGGYEGLLAGYRIAAYGDWRTTRPAHYFEGTNARTFCDSLKTWRKHFGVRKNNIWISTVRNPKRISITNLDAYHDGVAVKNVPSIGLFCRSW